MSEASEEPLVTGEMTRLLQKVRNYAFPPKEKTFFSIERIIGRYENPTSDLLQFFMAPDAGHDLGPIFLQAFLACLGNRNCNKLDLQNITTRREVRTTDGKFIDLLISGANLVLVIENKIYHWLANPFASYENYATEHANRICPGTTPLFAILSPEGKAVAEWPNWIPVSYQGYCRTLRTEFAKAVFANPGSKWQVFAREFILHLENELSNPTMIMTPEQIAFVEGNLQAIEQFKKLCNCYASFLLSELKDRLEATLPGYRPFQFWEVKDWALVCDKPLGNLSLRLVFGTPAYYKSNSDRRYWISVWIGGLTDTHRQRAGNLLAGADEEEGGEWVGYRQFDIHSRAEAVNGLCDLAKGLFDALESGDPVQS